MSQQEFSYAKLLQKWDLSIESIHETSSFARLMLDPGLQLPLLLVRKEYTRRLK